MFRWPFEKNDWRSVAQIAEVRNERGYPTSDSQSGLVRAGNDFGYAVRPGAMGRGVFRGEEARVGRQSPRRRAPKLIKDHTFIGDALKGRRPTRIRTVGRNRVLSQSVDADDEQIGALVFRRLDRRICKRGREVFGKHLIGPIHRNSVKNESSLTSHKLRQFDTRVTPSSPRRRSQCVTALPDLYARRTPAQLPPRRGLESLGTSCTRPSRRRTACRKS